MLHIFMRKCSTRLSTRFFFSHWSKNYLRVELLAPCDNTKLLKISYKIFMSFLNAILFIKQQSDLKWTQILEKVFAVASTHLVSNSQLPFHTIVVILCKFNWWLCKRQHSQMQIGLAGIYIKLKVGESFWGFLWKCTRETLWANVSKGEKKNIIIIIRGNVCGLFKQSS